MNVPIIFVHYGDSKELSDSLKIARESNPHTQIILLGDISNQKYGKIYNIDFKEFKDYSCDETNSFLRKFQYIRGGVNHGCLPPKKFEARCEFEKFCFLRWFYIYSYVRVNKLKSIWYFDSDTWILKNLSEIEQNFKEYECMQMNANGPAKGYITDVFLRKYLKTAREIFDDPSYLRYMIEQTGYHPDFTLCDMSAFYKCKQEQPLLIAPSILHDEKMVFDDALLLTNDFSFVFSPILGRKIKKLTFNNNRVLVQLKPKINFYELAVINASWLPDFYRNMLQNNIGFGSNYSKINFAFSAFGYMFFLYLKKFIKFLLRRY